MFKFIYYSFAITVVIYELWSLKRFGFTERVINMFSQYKEENLRLSEMDEEESNKLIKGCLYVIWHLCYFTWALLGFFTFQWYIFILLIILSIVTNKYFKNNETWHKIDAIASMGIAIFLILNAYHFNIGFSDLLKFLG